MANKNKKQNEESEKEQASMTLEEAKAYRASLYVPKEIKLTEEEKREEFRKFWTQEKTKYGKTRDLEKIIWLHLKAIKKTSPEQFEEGIAHFGLKKVK